MRTRVRSLQQPGRTAAPSVSVIPNSRVSSRPSKGRPFYRFACEGKVDRRALATSSPASGRRRRLLVCVAQGGGKAMGFTALLPVCSSFAAPRLERLSTLRLRGPLRRRTPKQSRA
jgi:hypothetical protein